MTSVTTGTIPGTETTPGNSQTIPYPRTSNQYVCLSHTPRGWAPTDFTSGVVTYTNSSGQLVTEPGRIPAPPPGQTSLDKTNELDDAQAPRVSYVPNESIMPRKKFCDTTDQVWSTAISGMTGGATSANAETLAGEGTTTTKDLCQVNVVEIANPENTILMGEFAQQANSLFGGSVGGGLAFKTHRPTNPIVVASTYTDYGQKPNGVAADGNTYNGKTAYPNANYFDGEQYEIFRGSPLYKLTVNEAWQAINAASNDQSSNNFATAITSNHIAYSDPEAHLSGSVTGSNYLFCDGHAALLPLERTLDPNNWMWGDKVYSVVDKTPLLVNPNPY